MDETLGDAAAEKPIVTALGGAQGGKVGSLGWGQEEQGIAVVIDFA